MIRIIGETVISEGDIVYRFSRSAGPGGQNVNKLNTRVTLFFDINKSRCLTTEQKQLLFDRLSSRISDDGLLTIVSQRHRTQIANRKSAQNRLVELLKFALRDIPVRKETDVPHAEKRKRLRRKRHRSEIKQLRKSVAFD
ncbi:MAG: alternative ribosome rescue aminoacyl-tRNA hydrolase ArfB [Sedimentisphaerales bacterium]